MAYYRATKKMPNAFDVWLRMVRLAEIEGTSAAARYYRTTKRTVRKWLRRYREGRLAALQHHRRAPKPIPHKMPRELENKTVELREGYRGWGVRRLKTYFGLPCRKVRFDSNSEQPSFTSARWPGAPDQQRGHHRGGLKAA